MQIAVDQVVVGSVHSLQRHGFVAEDRFGKSSLGSPRKRVAAHGAQGTGVTEGRGGDLRINAREALRVNLHGFEVCDPIGTGGPFRLYRAVRVLDGRNCLLKTAPSPGGLAVEVLRREFRLTRRLHLDGVSRALALVEGKDAVTLVLEDFGELLLERILREGRLPLTTSLIVASRVADALGSLHDERLVHRDLRPANLLVDPTTCAAQLTGLGFATPLSEETGRLDRPVDQQTDFYSLGVTLVEMLTERSPLQPDDRQEVAPEAVADIVLKLLSKSATDRYQHAQEIKADLERTLRDLQRAERTRAVEPVRTDTVDLAETAVILHQTSDLQELLGELLSALLRTSDAERGVLLSDDGVRLTVEATASVGSAGIRILTGPSCRKRKAFLRSVVERVRDSQEALVIDDALLAENLLDDEYVASRRPRSILSVPLVHQKRLVGLVYLENNSVSGAFDENQLQAVSLISSHAATAIENARLRERLVSETPAVLQADGKLKKLVRQQEQVQKQLEIALGENRRLQAQLDAEEVRFRSELARRPIVGNSAVLQKTLRSVEQVAPTQASVLLLGETGTGKELIARAVHARSQRRERPLIKLDCTVLPATLIEAELFGHEKGAFTGAHTKRVGRFEQADGATVFLDEIGELPLQLQSKLLRILEDQQFERLGSVRTIQVDVRIIAATNRDLAAAVEEGSFRSDLYYRLNAFPIEVPPLRSRREDIPALVHHFLAINGERMDKSVEISPEVMSELEAYHWPGNVRELEHVVERAMIISSGPMLTLDESFRASSSGIDLTDRYRLEDVERAHIVKVLEERGWAVKGGGNAADLLDMNPSTLRSRMKKLGIIRPASSTQESSSPVVDWTRRPVSRGRLRVVRVEGEV